MNKLESEKIEMDDILRSYAVDSSDGELDLITFPLGVDMAVQRDMSKAVKYERDYWQKYVDYRGSKVSRAINHARVNLVKEYCSPKARILDIGIGSGEFIEEATLSGLTAFGYDVNPFAKEWLQTRNLWHNIESENINDYEAITMWDVMEHMKNPSQLLSKVPVGKHVFLSIPCFRQEGKGGLVKSIKESKHYRPNEHYYYFTTKSLIVFMNLCGFYSLEVNKMEMEAGRVDIYSFAFKKGD